MVGYKKEDKIKINGTEYVIKALLVPLTNYPADLATSFFKEINLSLPREIRINALKNVLRPRVLDTRIARANLADEMNYRLSWFNQYTEVQLNNLFLFYNDTELEKEYFNELWLAIITYITEKGISKNDFEKLIKDSTDYSKTEGIKQQDTKKYNDDMNSIFFDSKDLIDGLRQNEIRPVLYKSSTINEIRELGLKYNVDVPKRLRKHELANIIIQELTVRDEMDENKEIEVLKMNIMGLKRYAINNNIKVSAELKKEEVIEYILLNADETKELYFIPSDSVYELEVHEVGEVMPDVTPVKETEKIVEEVVLEPVTVTPEILNEVEKEEPVEEIQEEVVEVIEETKVPTLVETEIAKLVAPNQVYVQQVSSPDKSFDFTTVEKIELNSVQFHGEKAARFNKNLNFVNNKVETPAVVEEDKVMKVEVVLDKKEKKRFTLGSFLLRLLVTIVIVALIIVIIFAIYAAITTNGTPGGFIKFEDSLSKLFNKLFRRPETYNFFEALRNFIVKTFKLQ